MPHRAGISRFLPKPDIQTAGYRPARRSIQIECASTKTLTPTLSPRGEGVTADTRLLLLLPPGEEGASREIPARCGTRFFPHAVMRRRVAQGRADQGARMFEPAGRVCAHPVRPEQRSVPVAQRRDDASGSPSLCLLSLGEARESQSPAGARPGLHPASLAAGQAAPQPAR